MLFNSIEFAIFLPVVFFFYWFVFNRNLKIQNLFLVSAGYLFYGWWDWRFLLLLVFSSTVDFFVGQVLNRENQSDRFRKLILGISIGINLGLLGFFKYYNFFVESFVEAFTLLGYSLQSSTLKVILPVGISFYTFQAMTYTIDVYRRKLEPTKDIIAFFAYVSFFPQLVAGPIERAVHMMPQYFSRRMFDADKATDGLRQILWGLFKKIVIADNCAIFVAHCFNNPSSANGAELLLGAVLFAFQIYCDFSGYSDIAIGCARLFGFDLMQNFAFPYFSRDMAEFWRRWHISLTTWFRDYVYIPLGGSKGGTLMKIRNTFIIFLVSGFWHGANWTFIVWGALNAIYFLPLVLFNKNRTNMDAVAQNKLFPSIIEITSILLTFGLSTLAWIFFRSKDISEAFIYISTMVQQITIHPGQLLLFFKLASVEVAIFSFSL
jgi:D-alanyl-lipoteichoic acid acyltransferase DltB (MBOAT superfamily)